MWRLLCSCLWCVVLTFAAVQANLSSICVCVYQPGILLSFSSMRRARSAHARILVSDVDTSMWARIQPVPSDVDSSDEDMGDADCTSKSRNLRTSFHSVPYRKRLAQAFQLLLVWLSRTLPFSDLDVACRCRDLVVEMLCSKLLCAGEHVNAGSVSDVR